MTSAPSPLLLLVPEAGPPWEVLERFVVHRLCEAGIWRSPRTSDGVSSLRVVEDGPDRARLAGRIWDIEQTLLSFWLDIERDRESPGRFTWTLYFDLDPSAHTARQLRDAVDMIAVPQHVQWRTVLAGHAVARNDRLTPEGPT